MIKYFFITYLFIQSLYAVNFNKLPKEMCKGITNCKSKIKRLSSSFYLAADDYGSKTILHPYYQKMVDLYKPTGIIYTLNHPHSILKVQKELKQIQNENDLYFLGGDHCFFHYQDKDYKIKPLPQTNSCQVRLQANLAKISGCNIIFNPPIETPIKGPDFSNYNEHLVKKVHELISTYSKVGIILVLKHFPFTHEILDIHYNLVDMKAPLKVIEKNHFPLFKEFAKYDNPIMTTHMISSDIDFNIITFSKKWIDLLRNNVGMKDNLVFSDSISMFRSYPDEILSYDFPINWKNNYNHPSILFTRTVLAGHNVVINREASEYQALMIKDVVRLMSENTVIKDPLNEVLLKNENKVKAFKEKYKKQLLFFPDVSQKEVDLLMKGVKLTDQVPDAFCKRPDIENIFKKIEIF